MSQGREVLLEFCRWRGEGLPDHKITDDQLTHFLAQGKISGRGKWELGMGSRKI
jgi:hypothetical protein